VVVILTATPGELRDRRATTSAGRILLPVRDSMFNLSRADRPDKPDLFSYTGQVVTTGDLDLAPEEVYQRFPHATAYRGLNGERCWLLPDLLD
jgi:hypothetical protein